MFTRWKVLLSVVVVIGIAALAAAGWLVFAPSPERFSASEILDRERASVSSLGSYKFTMDARLTVHVAGEPEHQETRTEAVVVADKGMYVRATGYGSYNETLWVDGRAYHRESNDGPWAELLGEWDASNFPNPGALGQLLDDLTEVSQEGEETIGDMRVNKISGNMDMAQHVKEAWGDDAAGGVGGRRAQMLAGNVKVTAWLGVEDRLLHAYTMEGSFPVVGEQFAYQYSTETRFSHFNEPLELPSPSAAR